MKDGHGTPQRLVLVGGGHSHVQVVKAWIRRPMSGVELWVVSPEPKVPYSGMVPGWLSGLYAYDEICIDLAALCASADAVLVRDEITGLDPARRQVRLRSGASIAYDVLSLDVGSTLHAPTIDDAIVLPLRPLSHLRSRWDALLADLADRPGASVTIEGVGGGAAGFEAVVALQRRLAAGPRPTVKATLYSTGGTVLPGLARGAVRRATEVLAERGITLCIDREFDAEASPQAGERTTRIVLWATGARPHAWQSGTGLALDAAGYIRVDRYLRSTSHDDVFASGDCAAWERPLPKAGVYAVRMGPVLANNLRAALGEGRLRAYRPQRRHLVLLSTADRRAIAARGSFSLSGSWVWRWKDALDRRFLRRFAVPQSTQSTQSPVPSTLSAEDSS